MDFRGPSRGGRRAVLALVAAAGCSSTSNGVRVDRGGVGSRGPVVVSGLPTPPGAANAPRPAAAAGNLQVLDWAGFKSAVSYTIDDGQPSQVEHYAELQATGVRIACAGAGVAAEVDGYTTFITGTLGAAGVRTSASPFGDVGFQAAAAERFFLNRGVQSGTVAPNDSTDPFGLPIWGPAANDTAETFNSAIDEAHTAGRWVIVLLHSIAPTTFRWFATVDISAITDSIAHAKSLADVWIDSMMNVGAYWRGQKLLASLTPMTSGNTQTWTWTLPAHFPTGKYLRVRVDGGTLSQGGTTLAWDSHGYYEVALDAGSLKLSP